MYATLFSNCFGTQSLQRLLFGVAVASSANQNTLLASVLDSLVIVDRSREPTSRLSFADLLIEVADPLTTTDLISVDPTNPCTSNRLM